MIVVALFLSTYFVLICIMMLHVHLENKEIEKKRRKAWKVGEFTEKRR